MKVSLVMMALLGVLCLKCSDCEGKSALVQSLDEPPANHQLKRRQLELITNLLALILGGGKNSAAIEVTLRELLERLKKLEDLQSKVPPQVGELVELLKQQLANHAAASFSRDELEKLLKQVQLKLSQLDPELLSQLQANGFKITQKIKDVLDKMPKIVKDKIRGYDVGMSLKTVLVKIDPPLWETVDQNLKDELMKIVAFESGGAIPAISLN